MRDLTVVIPTFNMGRFLPALLESMTTSSLKECLSEIIVVCDRSSDGSEEIIREFIEKQKPGEPKVRLLEIETRKGVFFNRWTGAKAASTTKLLFLDSRIKVPTSTANFLSGEFSKLTSLCAVADIDSRKNIYNLYWLRSHAAVFWRREKDLESGPIEVRTDNFDQYVVGTTGFFCSRSVFLECCESFQGETVYSDDTWLMKKMAALEPIWIHPQFRIHWEPRDRLVAFLKHLYNRGPGFAEYHVFERRGLLFYGVVCGFLFLGSVFILLFFAPVLALSIFSMGLLLAAGSTFLLAQSFTEFVKLAPLHVGVLAAYGVGALRGIWVIWRKRCLLKSST
jgi:hypothetical protein